MTINSDVAFGIAIVASSDVDPQGDGSLNDGDSEDFKCSSSSSSNPPSTITWSVTNDDDGTDDVTMYAKQNISQGKHNGYDVRSIIAIKGSREMNGRQLTCNLMYNGNAEHTHDFHLDILCKYYMEYFLKIAIILIFSVHI